MNDAVNWRLVASMLAWAQSGEEHTEAEQRALDLYDRAVVLDQAWQAMERTDA